MDMPANHLPDSVFVAGNFNGWNPQENGRYFSVPGDDGFIEIVNLQAGDYQYKFTRGNWNKSECFEGGKARENRFIKLTADTLIKVTIAAWQDDFTPVVKQHTASPNVQIIDTAFAMPQLATTRRIWLYLPPGYSKSNKHYPVMYMHDGQNIFDDFSSAYGEWGVDECVDSLVKTGKPGCIIVGIDNGPKRMNEYNPYDHREFGKGAGDQYLDFIAHTLKPFIDKRYHTLTNRENTIIAGSSMGGLISYYAMLKYPGTFGKAGIFSPAFWTADKIKSMTDSTGKNVNGVMFFYIGGQEGEEYVNDMNEIVEKLGDNSSALIYAVTDPSGNHNEQAWKKWFHEFYKWVLATGFNNVVDLDED